jgi:hypothetical protein
MKKLLILFAILAFTISVNAQFRNIQINETVTYQDFVLDSCYIVVSDLQVMSFKSLSALAEISVYKNRTIAQNNPDWKIYPAQIPYPCVFPIGAEFTQGDIFTKISEAIKLLLLETNPTWKNNNIIIE